MNRKYKKLIGNSLVFAIGNFGSKIISVILVPIYTYYLTTEEYGVVDIVVTTTTMLLPILSLSIYQAALRFAMDSQEEKADVLSNCLIVTIIGSILAFTFYPALKYFNVLEGILEYMYIILIVQSFEALFAQFTRALGKVKIFAVNGIIKTFITGTSNILLIVYFKYGISGYLLSMIIANSTAIIYLFLTTKIYKYIKFTSINKPLIKRMLSYSLPLIPNSFMWWLVNASNRYFIGFFAGVSVNGLFAVASKIPTLLTIFTSIFSQAWQLSAIDEYNSETKSKFYSEIFNYYRLILLLGSSAILVVLKPLIQHFIAEGYYMSWTFVPFLLLGVVFSSFSGFLGTNYIAAKETSGVFRTSLLGGIASLLLNFLLVPTIGGIGAAVSTMLSFLIMWLARVVDTKKYIEMTINKRAICFSLIIISTQIAVLFQNINNVLEIGLQLILFTILLISEKKLFIDILKIIKKEKA